jgi:hypothetical protein
MEDNSDEPHIRVGLEWELDSRRRKESDVPRANVLCQSFCAVGECVLTAFGTGVLLGFRSEDEKHVVQLWGSMGAGRNLAYMGASSISRVIPAAIGLAVETPLGRGMCRGFRPGAAVGGTAPPDAVHEDVFVVDFPWSRAFVPSASVRCPVAKVLPLICRFLEYSVNLFKVHTGKITMLREALEGLGLEKLQEKLTATASDAMEMVTRIIAPGRDGRVTANGLAKCMDIHGNLAAVLAALPLQVLATRQKDLLAVKGCKL